MEKLAGIGKKYRAKLGEVLRNSPSILTSKEVSETLSVSKQEAGRLLSRWHKSGWIGRIKRGFYTPIDLSSKKSIPSIEEPNLVATVLYGPGYVGGFSAVKHWDLSEQIGETTMFFTLKQIKDRNPKHSGLKFKLKTTSSYKVFGLKNVWYGDQKIRVSDPSKTMIDLLDDPKLVGGIRIVSDIFVEYFNSEYFDFDELINYGKKMKNKTIFKRLGFILELFTSIEQKKINKLRGLISLNYSELDSTLESCEFLKVWKLKVSRSWMREYDKKV